jgi:hypothetical protein
MKNGTDVYLSVTIFPFAASQIATFYLFLQNFINTTSCVKLAYLGKTEQCKSVTSRQKYVCGRADSRGGEAGRYRDRASSRLPTLFR